MEDFTQRLITEQEELSNKLTKLLSFLESAKFNTISPNHQILLAKQLTAMAEYNNILKERIYLLTDFRKEAVQTFLKKCKFSFYKGQVYFSTTMDKFTLFFNDNGVEFFELWNGYSASEKDKMLKECFIVR